MRRGALSGHFTGVVAKRLKAVEVMPSTSNQHEFNGVRELRNLFGDERIPDCPTHFIWFGDDDEVFAESGVMTWYDARERHPTRSEYRLYFRSNPVMDGASTGDLLLLAKQRDGSLLAVIAPGGSTMEGQLLWLFDVPVSDGRELEYRDLTDDDRALGFAERYILEELGIEAEEPDAPDLDALLEQFGLGFPSTTVFSAFARDTLPDVDPRDDPDAALLAWIEREEALFRRQEKRIVASRLEEGFFSEGEADVDGFVSFSLSVHNRRKSRAGHALEHHLREIFDRFGVRYSHGAFTEGRKKPDFLFPGAGEYQDPNFPADSLLMLGAKSTCKDRWRQVLSEAARIPDKHLLTLEPAISVEQTSEMQASRLQLVLPAGLHGTYREEQRAWLMDLGDLISVLPLRI
jgi:hypothetical protein